jgi:hypothetical protein
MDSKRIEQITFTCETCGNKQAFKVVEYWVETVIVERPTGYFGERPEEYGQYPDSPRQYVEEEKTVRREKVIRVECPKCNANLAHIGD